MRQRRLEVMAVQVSSRVQVHEPDRRSALDGLPTDRQEVRLRGRSHILTTQIDREAAAIVAARRQVFG